jgi:hypothetical protein
MKANTKDIYELFDIANSKHILISNSLEKLTALKAEGIKNITELLNNPHDYLLAIAHLSPQSKATKIEDLIRYFLHYDKVKPSKNKGDAIDPLSNEYIEFKISTTNQDNQINAVQLRVWQDIDRYIIGYIDETDFNNSHFFLLSKKELQKELRVMGESAMHGTKEANKVNENVELALRIPVDLSNKDFQRWIKKYSFELLNKFIRKGKQNG